jgi:hypothetical protein
MNTQNLKRKYYEVWGNLEAQNNTLKLVLFGLIIALIVLLFLSFLGSRKPPVVIRVNDIGKAETVSDFPVNNAVSKPELFYFTKLFIEKFTAYNSYTISTDLSEAFCLMTKNYQTIAKKEVIDSKLVSQIGQAALHAAVTLRDIKVEREDNKYAVMSFIGLRTILSYVDRNFKEESLFKGDIILKKVKRSMNNPHGLLVDEYREVLVKEI